MFEARRRLLPAMRSAGVVCLVACLLGCATSREDSYVASVIAEAMAGGVVSDDSASATIASPSAAETSPSTPATVSIPVQEPAAVVAADNLVPAPEPAAAPARSTISVTNSADPSLVKTETATAAMDRLDSPKPSEPTIQPDSVLWVSVVEDPSLNGRYVVNNSSAIDFGYVGLVFLQDMNVQQAEAAIKTVLEGRYLNHATVSVKIAKASYDSVGVLGNVEVAGEIKIGPGATITLNDALRRAGGLRGNRESNRVKIIRGGLRTPFGPAAEGEVLSLLSTQGDLQIPVVYLRNNDLVYVFAAESPQLEGPHQKSTGVGKRIILLGEVPRRGVIEFGENEPCTLMHLLFKIGGLPRFAKANRIQIVRRDKDGHEKTFVVNGESLMKEGDPRDDIVLESGDRVIVPQRKIAFF